MNKTLQHFDLDVVYSWFEQIKKIDLEIKDLILENIDLITKEGNKLPENLKINLQEKTNLYNFENFEAFHGYTVYAFPDNKKLISKTNPDIYYGLAKATSYGITHTHHLSDAYNLVLDGEGIFIGDKNDLGKYNNYYHEQKLEKDVELEIPIGMTHGHLVKNNKPIWFLFVQECGFKPGLRCEGDFHIKEDIDLSRYGSSYK